MRNKRVNFITVNTDASFHPELKVGGYAFYIICDWFKITKSGMFKKNPANSHDAEIMCIGNAIATLLIQKEIPFSNVLHINTDSTSSIERIKSRNSLLSETVSDLINQLTERIECEVVFRHVKAHNGTKDARSYVNNWCDTEAKKWMRKAAQEHKQLTHA